MAGLDDLLKNLPIGDIAKQLGVNTDDATSAISAALPALLGGMQANAQDEKGAASLGKALSSHKGKAVTKVADIDTADGEKIVKNIFGSNTDKVVSNLSATGGEKSNVIADLLPKVLPMLAPLVMGYLAQQFSGKDEAPAKKSSKTVAKGESGGGIGDLLGGLLGGGSSSNNDSNPIGDLLGGLLGGGNQKSNSGGNDMLSNILGGLGGLLGGGKR